MLGKLEKAARWRPDVCFAGIGLYLARRNAEIVDACVQHATLVFSSGKCKVCSLREPSSTASRK